MMFSVDPMSRMPVYEQIINQVKKYIILGLLNESDPLPSVRNMSVDLSVNPNTVQRSYNELTRDGIVVSLPGRGSFISRDAKKILVSEIRKQLVNITGISRLLSDAGVTRDEIIKAVDKGINNGKEAVNL